MARKIFKDWEVRASGGKRLDRAHSAGELTPLRFADVRDLVPGHGADERPDSVPEHEHRGP